MSSHKIDELTRYLKAVRDIEPTDFEILQALIKADLDPEEISSVTRLRGSKSGVIRVRMKTQNSVDILDKLVKEKKLSIGGVLLGSVTDRGHFVEVLLENVPMSITDSDVEEEMSKYGRVVKSEKQYLDYAGCRIANEKRTVLFSSITSGSSLENARIPICGTVVFSSIVKQTSKSGAKGQKCESEKNMANEIGEKTMRRKSMGEIIHYANEHAAKDSEEDDWLLSLQRRRSFKVKEREGHHQQQMSSVAYRQSIVVRDEERVDLGVGGGTYDILTYKDLKLGHALNDPIPSSESRKISEKYRAKDFQEKKDETNKLNWLKAFDKRIVKREKLSKKAEKEKKSNSTEMKELKIIKANLMIENKKKKTENDVEESSQIFNLKLNRADVKPQKKVNWAANKKSDVKPPTPSSIIKNPKSCNETFANFLDLRRKQKRNEAFEQLSAYLI